MPIFEYTCKKCGKVFEKLVMRQVERPQPCPHCGSKKVERQFSTFSATISSPKSSRVCAPSGIG
ncbi:MAG: zinc ribbon domain-containing protein [Acidobacteria bacterium]|nr:zinc ribbon domain-containing protein [Acidobacteriota bacterium]MBI1982709.1 zinc ribbon domain-containing protein [Acidobacteriota bacterium]